jgi:hypothetical protein
MSSPPSKRARMYIDLTEEEIGPGISIGEWNRTTELETILLSDDETSQDWAMTRTAEWVSTIPPVRSEAAEVLLCTTTRCLSSCARTSRPEDSSSSGSSSPAPTNTTDEEDEEEIPSNPPDMVKVTAEVIDNDKLLHLLWEVQQECEALRRLCRRAGITMESVHHV